MTRIEETNYKVRNGSLYWVKPGITEVVIPEVVHTIGEGALESHTVEIVKFPSTLRSIDTLAFFNSSIKSAVFPEGLAYIGRQAFHSTPLEHVEFPSTLEMIGNGAFLKTSLTRVELPEKLTTIGTYAFRNSPIRELTLSGNHVNLDANAFSATPLEALTIDGKTYHALGSYGSVYYIKDDKTLGAFGILEEKRHLRGSGDMRVIFGKEFDKMMSLPIEELITYEPDSPDTIFRESLNGLVRKRLKGLL